MDIKPFCDELTMSDSLPTGESQAENLLDYQGENPFPLNSDEFWMFRALQQAKHAESVGEVPVGAVVVLGNTLVGEGFNQVISGHDASAHAEIIALRQASQLLENYRLPETTLYVTLEPCSMCAGAIVHARVARIVYAATEPKAGVACSQQHFFESEFLNHHPEVQGGVLAKQSSAILSHFFKQRRLQAKRLRQTQLKT